MDLVGKAQRGFLVVVQDTRAGTPRTASGNRGHVKWTTATTTSAGPRCSRVRTGRSGCWGSATSAKPIGWQRFQAAGAEGDFAKAHLGSEPDDGLFARGGAQEIGITVPWSLMQRVPPEYGRNGPRAEEVAG
jgi:hypothetical protein